MSARTYRIMARFSKEEHAQLVKLADEQLVEPAVFLREIVLDRMRVNLNRSDRLRLAATLRVHAVCMELLKASLSPEQVAEIEAAVRLQGTDSVLAFLEEMGA